MYNPNKPFREDVFVNARATKFPPVKTVAIIPLTSTAGLHIIAICGRSVRFEKGGKIYYATNSVANKILSNPEMPVFVETREFNLLQPDGREVPTQQDWLCVPSRF